MNKYHFLAFIAIILVSCTSNKTQVTILDKVCIDDMTNVNYVSMSKPLQSQQLIKLPSGTIKPAGWIETLLNLQKDGLNGHLMEISAWLQKNDNAWLKEGGKWGWEEVPYWLRGYAETAYVLDDEKMLAESKIWIEAILNSQQENGNFGPSSRAEGTQDFWPNMVALWILQSYYEYTEDSRVIDFMSKYFDYELSVPDEKFLANFWENSRGGDNLWSVLWLYNRTGNNKLLELAEKIHRNTADWTKSTQLPNWHCVNVAQCFREPATYYLLTGDKQMLRASYNVFRFIRQTFGQVPGGMYGADENARQGFVDPRQGIEVCALAEQMCSDEIMLAINADLSWAENLEDVFFNTFPAAFTSDMKALRYITSPNMVLSDDKNHRPGIDNGGPFLCMNPFSSRCCQHNHGFALPYYVNSLLYATPDNGIASVLFNSFSADVLVGDHKNVNIKSETNYPFDSKIKYSFTIQDSVVNFPFYLRIPSWTNNPVVKVNGEKFTSESGKYFKIEREWENGDVVEVTFPMELSYRVWSANKNSVSVDYGPLTLSLKIKEKYERLLATSTAISDSKWQDNVDTDSWPAYTISAESSWNYAIDPNSVSLVSSKPLENGVNPFTQENIPLLFKANASIVPIWKIDEYGLCGVLPYDDDCRKDSIETIELIPMGAARLRISSFPQL